jgi:hypothetical protein
MCSFATRPTVDSLGPITLHVLLGETQVAHCAWVKIRHSISSHSGSAEKIYTTQDDGWRIHLCHCKAPPANVFAGGCQIKQV